MQVRRIHHTGGLLADKPHTCRGDKHILGALRKWLNPVPLDVGFDEEMDLLRHYKVD
jgi:hypothetical protein